MDAKAKKLLAIYTFSHFCVDFACFFMLFSIYDNLFLACQHFYSNH